MKAAVQIAGWTRLGNAGTAGATSYLIPGGSTIATTPARPDSASRFPLLRPALVGSGPAFVNPNRSVEAPHGRHKNHEHA